MDFVTVLVVLGILVLGGSSVYWGMSWQVAVLSDALEDAKSQVEALESAVGAIIGTERALDRARDLPGLDELRLLLRPGLGSKPSQAGGELEGGHGKLDAGGRGGVPPLQGHEEDPSEQGSLDSLRKALGGPK